MPEFINELWVEVNKTGQALADTIVELNVDKKDNAKAVKFTGVSLVSAFCI